MATILEIDAARRIARRAGVVLDTLRAAAEKAPPHFRARSRHP